MGDKTTLGDCALGHQVRWRLGDPNAAYEFPFRKLELTVFFLIWVI